MRNPLIPSVLVMMTTLAVPHALLAQWDPQDLSGTWIRINTPDSNSDTFTFQEPPMTPWAEKRYEIVHWSVQPRGGHFAPFEQPALFTEDLRAFGRHFR